eukprot:7492714-Pyramimonas_sp.AAC.2
MRRFAADTEIDWVAYMQEVEGDSPLRQETLDSALNVAGADKLHHTVTCEYLRARGYLSGEHDYTYLKGASRPCTCMLVLYKTPIETLLKSRRETADTS